MKTEPDLFTVAVKLYAPHGSGEGYVDFREGHFDIDLSEEFTRESCADLLGRFIRLMAPHFKRDGVMGYEVIAGARFPPLESEWVYADSSGRELIQS
ncbi:hypothetical protein [Streptomyces sp. 5-10]|uniref:hypothetical protein n=1 Tax=Streptomyces sp. 5-10 TaxID=878925 RepID=UPI00168B10BE|nr:hypothetical protein [Streptomyces sp. 5-10]MBD3004614.1 hypothetical protein [Streptomyces sp. 5-10]